MSWTRVIAREFLWVLSVIAFFVLWVIAFVLIHPRANPGFIDILLRDLFFSPPMNAFQASLLVWILANYFIRYLAIWAFDKILER
jgi:hypothetical protein